MQPFPFDIYFQYLQRIPKGVIIGEEIRSGKDVVIFNKEMNSHIYALGKTGAGKTMWLYLLLVNLLAMGKRVIFVDPLGTCFDLIMQWFSYITREFYRREDSQFLWFQKEVLPNILFFDLSQDNHPYRSNMIQSFPDETLNKTIERLVLFFDSLFSSMDIELQRRQGLVNIIALFAATKTPMEQARHFLYNQDFRDTILRQAELQSTVDAVHRAIKYWHFLGETYRASSYGDKVFSLLTGLSQFEESQSVSNFLLTGECNINWKDIFEHKSLFIKIPANSLPVRKVFMNYLYSGVLFSLISNRVVTKNTDTLYIGSDESATIFNEEYANMITKSRNKLCFFISAHQARKQLLTDELIRVASVIEDQSDICAYFRVGYEDAVKIVEEKLSPSGMRKKHHEKSVSITNSVSQSQSSGWSKIVSWMKSLAHGLSTQESYAQSNTETTGITETQALSESINHQFSVARAKGKTETVSIGKTFQISWTKGQNLGRTRTDGFTLSQTDGASLAHIQTKSGTVTVTEQSSQGTSQSDGQTRSQGQNSSYPVRYSVGYSSGASGYQVPGYTFGRTESDAYQNVKSISNNISRGQSHSEATSEGETQTISTSESASLARQLGESIAVLKSFAESVSQSFQQGTSNSDTTTSTDGIGESLSKSHSVARNLNKSEGDSVTQSYGTNASESQGRTDGVSEQESYSKTLAESVSLTYREVYYSIGEEARLLAQEIRSLPPRQFLLAVKNKPPVIVNTAECFILPTTFDKMNFLLILKEYTPKFLQDKNTRLALAPSGSKIPLLFSSSETKLEESVEIYRSVDFDHFFPPALE